MARQILTPMHNAFWFALGFLIVAVLELVHAILKDSPFSYILAGFWLMISLFWFVRWRRFATKTDA